MDPDRQSSAPREPLDDAALAAIVRDLADDWRMPPQRLGEVTWRDRVGRGRGSGGGRSGGGVHWTRRLFGAAAIAVAATIVLSFGAVWLTAPRGNLGAVGASPSASSSASAAPSASAVPSASLLPAGSPLPQLVLGGALPTPSTVMLHTEGGYQLADLSTGFLGAPVIGQQTGPSAVFTRPGGGWVCICGTWTQLAAGSPNGLRLTLLPVGADGMAGDSQPLKDLAGSYDDTAPTADQPQLVDATIVASPDGRYALIGWSERHGIAGWVIGVDTLDLATLAVVASASIPLSEPMVVDGRARVRVAPTASLSPRGDALMLTSFWYLDDPNTATPPTGTDHWVAPYHDGLVGGVPSPVGLAFATAGSSEDASCIEFDAGLIDSTSYYTYCRTAGNRWELARRSVDGGTVLGTTELPATVNTDGLALTTRTDDALFIWSPVARSMTRVDLATGEVMTGQGETAAAPDGVIDRLAGLGRQVGRLLAPSALAKILIEPGVVVDQATHRIFALGVGGEDGAGGSTGVDAFDTETLASVGHWAPTADFSSIAISGDGTAVYAASMGGVAADGSEFPGNGASVTVFDSAGGQVRVLAGKLGTGGIGFTEPVLR